MEQGRLVITDFTLISVAHIDPVTLTISDPERVRAYDLRKRVLNNEPLVVTNEFTDSDLTEFYDYLERT